jgi:hypothetical protein
MQTAKSTGRRRRTGNRTASYGYCPPGRAGTSFEQPVPVSYYLGDMLQAITERDTKKVYEILNLQSHG